ncbi:hypothetical protein ACTXT7_014361 [Hymenolepis weldensis]
MEGTQTISDQMRRFLIDLQTIQLKSSIRNAISNSFHLSDHTILAVEGSLTIEIPGEVNPISLTFSNEGNPNINSQKILSPSKRKAFRPVKFTGQPSTNGSTISQISNQTSRSESCSPSSLFDCALDLTISASVPSSIKETPVKQENTPVNVIMGLLHQNPIPTTSLSIFPSMSTLPTMLSATQFESHSVTSSPKKRRRLGGTCIRKTGEARQFRCNQCDDMFYSLRDLENHTQETHGGYKCHLCKMAFTQRSNLQRHALKHVDFRPFECNLCGRAYYRKDHLMRHMQRTHPLHPVEKNIQVKLRSSESLDYLRLSSADKLTTSNVSHDEHSNVVTYRVEKPKHFNTDSVDSL